MFALLLDTYKENGLFYTRPVFDEKLSSLSIICISIRFVRFLVVAVFCIDGFEKMSLLLLMLFIYEVGLLLGYDNYFSVKLEAFFWLLLFA